MLHREGNTGEQKDDSISVLAVGDIMLSRQVGQTIQNHEATYLFHKVSEFLKAGDILFGNLECVISDRGQPRPKHDPNVTFRAPKECLQGLMEAGFNVLSLANNHILDYGPIGLNDTIIALRESGIRTIGAGNDEVQARTPAIFRIKDVQIGFLAYHQLLGKIVYAARRNRPGVSQLRKNYCIEDVRKLREKADIVIVSLHWGRDYCPYPSPYDIKLARLLIDNGCHLVLGHHTHVPQGYEYYKKGLIFYGLGNFIFDEPFLETKKSIILFIKLNKKGLISFRIVPVISNDCYQPVLATGQETDFILKSIEDLSTEYSKVEWISDFDRDPTDKVLWHTFRAILNGGDYRLIYNYPLKAWSSRLLPLFFKKIKSYIHSKSLNLKKDNHRK